MRGPRRLAASLLLLAALAPASRAEAQELTLGSKTGETLEGGLILFGSQMKSRSHFGFGEHGAREGEVAFVQDLGVSSTLPAPGLRLKVDVLDFGWVGGEVLGFEERGDVAQLDRLRALNGLALQPGDVLDSSTRTIWGGLHYGFDVRLKFLGFLEVSAAPTFGFGFFDLEERVKRIFPEPSPRLGGEATAFVLTPGVRAEVEAFDLLRLGVEGEIGLTGLRFAVSTPHANLWERVRVYGGINFEIVDVTVGWRLAATHLEGDGEAVDMRLRGVDVTLGVRF